MKVEEIKRRLYEQCAAYVQNRLDTIHEAIRNAQESANSEDKSSAGDKHETSRSMAQLEQEKLSSQLLEVQKMQQALLQISPDKLNERISAGSVILTNNGNYYISISAGRLTVDNTVYFAVSPASPIGIAFYKAGSENGFVFNNQHFSVKKVF